MPYCGKCGKEINGQTKFCGSCGAEVKRANNVSEQATAYVAPFNNIIKGNAFEQKNIFIASVVAVFLDLLIQFTGMIEYNLYITDGSISVFKFFDLAKTFDSNDEIYGFLNFLFVLSPIFLVISAILLLAPLLTGKAYTKKSFIVPKLATIYTSVIYILLITILTFAFEDTMDMVSVSFLGYLYCLITIFAVIVVYKFAKEIKKSKNNIQMNYYQTEDMQ